MWQRQGEIKWQQCYLSVLMCSIHSLASALFCWKHVKGYRKNHIRQRTRTYVLAPFCPKELDKMGQKMRNF